MSDLRWSIGSLDYTQRMPALRDDAMDDAQRRAAAALASGPRGGVNGPFIPLLRSPDLMDRLQRVGAYLRFDSALPAAIRELAILIVARHWTQQFEWAMHVPIARDAGVGETVIDAIRDGRHPEDAPEPQAACHALCDELLRHHGVSDATYARAVACFGERGVIDLLGVAGYFVTVSMVLNVARVPPSATGATPLLPFPR